MSAREEILKILKKGNIEWDKAHDILLEKGYKKNTIAMAKKRMLENGEITETIENGKKYISILKVQNLSNYFDESFHPSMVRF